MRVKASTFSAVRALGTGTAALDSKVRVAGLALGTEMLV